MTCNLNELDGNARYIDDIEKTFKRMSVSQRYYNDYQM
jgi:hypothetical protein